jgi:REP element-mobilizing transposase RayT
MARPLRIHVPGAFYHVTLRGNHRQDIFFTSADRRLFDEITAEVLERFTARLHAYCWMTNHMHMLIQVGDAPLGRLMLRIAGRYARTVRLLKPTNLRPGAPNVDANLRPGAECRRTPRRHSVRARRRAVLCCD